MNTENSQLQNDKKSLNKARLALIAAMLILFFPLLFWFFMILNSKTRCKPLMMYTYVNEAGDTIPRIIPPFEFKTQDGTTFTQDSLKGHYHIANFIFTTCPGICPRLSQEFVKLQEKVKDSPEIKMVSYSVDPVNDSVPALKAYAERYKAIRYKWYFLTGNEEDMVRVVTQGYMQPAVKTPNGAEKVTHSNLCLLVDKDLRIRGHYDILNAENGAQEMKRLLDEINVLACEYREQKEKAEKGLEK